MKRKTAKSKEMYLAYAGLVLTVFFWSINTVLARGMALTIRPMALSFYRWVFALIFILPFAWPGIRKNWHVIKENLGFLIVLAIFSVSMYNSILYIGAQYTTATNISLVIAAMPGLTIFLAWLINKEQTGRLQLAGVVISILGMVIIVCKGSFSVLLELEFNRGDLLIILSIFSWAIYSVLLKKRKIDMPPISFLGVLIFFGVIGIFPFYLQEYHVHGGFELRFSYVMLFVFLGLFPSIISYICWNFGVKTTGSSTASVFMYLIPVFTALLAFVFLGEHLFGYHFFGGALILFGLLMSSN